MRVIGIDPGIHITGWGIVDAEDREVQLVDYGVIKTKRTQPLPIRLKHVYDGVSGMIAQYKPEVLSIEEAFYSKNVKVALTIGQARAAAILAGTNAALEVAEYSPREIKQSSVGLGAAVKGQVQYMVKVLLKLDKEPSPVDAADALAAAICHINRAHLKYLA
ncbi:MAG: crossover junction endodeoxyribonuclease RuvC [Gemmatimonadetes bacterium]|nr:MAG: crossover junction endodeoxyribonuclease RuvC [Gemmatimonadota bacterium]